MIKYQDVTIVNPNRNYPLKEKFSYIILMKYNLSAKLKNKENSLVIEAKNYKEDIFEVAKKPYGGVEELQPNKVKITRSEDLDIAKIQEIAPNIFDKR